MNLPGITPGDVTEIRRAICGDCEHNKHGKVRGQYCGKCGCNIPAKTRIMKATCPLKKW